MTHDSLTATRMMLYTEDERRRRDESPWTVVQGVLAPLQFAVFLVSLVLVLRYLASGEGLAAATISIIVKTGLLYTIMITGSIWEKVVFGRYLFARPFFWEDLVSMAVIALHTAYLAALLFAIGSPREQMLLALAAYAAYVVNAAQFLLKLRTARREAAPGAFSGKVGTAFPSENATKQRARAPSRFNRDEKSSSASQIAEARR